MADGGSLCKVFHVDRAGLYWDSEAVESGDLEGKGKGKGEGNSTNSNSNTIPAAAKVPRRRHDWLVAPIAVTARVSLALDVSAQAGGGVRGPPFPVPIVEGMGEEEGGGHLARCSVSLSLEPCASGRRGSTSTFGGGGGGGSVSMSGSSAAALSVLALDMEAVAAVAGPAAVAAAAEESRRRKFKDNSINMDKDKNKNRLRMRYLARLGLLQKDIAGSVALDGGVRIALQERQWRQALELATSLAGHAAFLRRCRFRRLRPRAGILSPEADGGGAKAWWEYAVRTVLQARRDPSLLDLDDSGGNGRGGNGSGRGGGGGGGIFGADLGADFGGGRLPWPALVR